MKAPTPTPCAPCGRVRKTECSHVDCPNRKPVTAQESGDVVRTRDACGGVGIAVVKLGRFFTD